MREIGWGDVILAMLIVAVVIGLSMAAVAFAVLLVLGHGMGEVVTFGMSTYFLVCVVGGLLLMRVNMVNGEAGRSWIAYLALFLIFPLIGAIAHVLGYASADDAFWFVVRGTAQVSAIFFAVQLAVFFKSRDVGAVPQDPKDNRYGPRDVPELRNARLGLIRR